MYISVHSVHCPIYLSSILACPHHFLRSPRHILSNQSTSSYKGVYVLLEKALKCSLEFTRPPQQIVRLANHGLENYVPKYHQATSFLCDYLRRVIKKINIRRDITCLEWQLIDTKFSFENSILRNHSRDLGLYGKIILKLNLNSLVLTL
jgi:hypothetical protein